MTSIAARSRVSAATTSTTASNRFTRVALLESGSFFAAEKPADQIESFPVGAFDGADNPTERLDERLERSRVVGKTPAVEHQGTPMVGCGSGFGSEPALSCTGWSADEHDLPATGNGSIPRRIDRASLPDAPDEFGHRCGVN